MSTINTTLFYSGLLLLISLFQGCSGHALQDLIDGDKNATKQMDGTKDKKVAPSQNKALNSISPSSTASDEHDEHRHIQKSTNTWLEDEWEPLTESNTSTTNAVKADNNISEDDANQTISQDDNSSSGLQYYVDKAEVYFDNKEKRDANKTKVPSHTEKIDAMPGIGKPAGRR